MKQIFSQLFLRGAEYLTFRKLFYGYYSVIIVLWVLFCVIIVLWKRSRGK